ncbi:hypothetical protein L208DRAFT_1233954 [Tricholoma matsutake]|nr:hypothetical protein L208DRAFT_1233954 [Tricholoma matsutake 945]
MHCTGANASHVDKMKGMKGIIIEWIMPPDQDLAHSTADTSSIRFQHEAAGVLLCPAGVDWSNSE